MVFPEIKLSILEISNFLIIMDVDFKTRKKEIYIPLKKVLDLIIKRVKDLDIHVPLSRIARMDLAGKFDDESLEPLKNYIYDYLNIANKYRRIYFEYLKKTKMVFDQEMTNEGSFAPGLKQYDSLKNQLFEELLKSDGKVWIRSYDQYLPTIREHADKRSKNPKDGQKMFNSLKTKFNSELKDLKKSQLLTLKKSKKFQKDLRLALKNPELGWGEWSDQEQNTKHK